MQGNSEGNGNESTPEGGKKPRVWSQAQLDGQRQFKLKAALKKGPLAAEDQAWLDEWSKAHPPKERPVKLAAVKDADPEPEIDYPDPERLEAAPKVPVTDKAKQPAKKGPRWQSKYAAAMEVELVKADGSKLKVSFDGESGREVACTLGASLICGVFQYLEASLASVGKKPLVGVDMMFGACVLTLDKYLPQKLNPEPEHVLAIGFASAGVQYGLAYKAIAEAKQKKGAADEHKRKLEEMRERTRKTEAQYTEANRANEVATHGAQATPTAPPPQAAPDPVRDQGPLVIEATNSYREKPPGWDIKAPVELPDDAVI
jgi:hypothetical protein